MSRFRSAVLAAALSGSIALATGANAAPEPTAGTVKTVTATLQVGGSDGRTYVVTVTGQQRDRLGRTAASEVSLGWKSCVGGRKGKPSCSVVTSYRIHTTSGEFSVAADGTSAQLRLPLAGSSLRLSWTRTDASQTFGVAIDTDGADAYDPTASGTATATGSAFGVTCKGDATVRTDYVVRAAAIPTLPGSTRAPRVPVALSSARRCLGH